MDGLDHYRRLLKFIAPADANEVREAFREPTGDINYPPAFGSLSRWYDLLHANLEALVECCEREAKLREASCTTTTETTDSTAAAALPPAS